MKYIRLWFTYNYYFCLFLQRRATIASQTSTTVSNWILNVAAMLDKLLTVPAMIAILCVINFDNLARYSLADCHLYRVPVIAPYSTSCMINTSATR